MIMQLTSPYHCIPMLMYTNPHTQAAFHYAQQNKHKGRVQTNLCHQDDEMYNKFLRGQQ